MAFPFKTDVKYRGHQLGVEGLYTPGAGASRRGHPEGMVVELTDIYLLKHNPDWHEERARKLPRQMVERLNDDDGLIDAVIEAIKTQIG